MIAVGFSASANQGIWCIIVYFLVHNIDGYVVVPYVARRTVDLAPAVLLAMQLLMAALFGILGVLFADPILATLKVVLVDLSKQQAAKEGRGAGASSIRGELLLRRLLPACCCCCCCCACCACICWSIAAPPRAIFRTRTSKVSALFLGKPGGAGPFAEGELLRHGEAIFATLLHPASSPRRSRDRRWSIVNGCGPPMVLAAVEDGAVVARQDIVHQRGVGAARSARPCRP